MKKEMLNQELDMVNGGKTVSESKKKSEDVANNKVSEETWKELTRAVNKMLNNPINAYDMIEKNKRSGYYIYVK